jgi:hypothetical protein
MVCTTQPSLVADKHCCSSPSGFLLGYLHPLLLKAPFDLNVEYPSVSSGRVFYH